MTQNDLLDLAPFGLRCTIDDFSLVDNSGEYFSTVSMIKYRADTICAALNTLAEIREVVNNCKRITNSDDSDGIRDMLQAIGFNTIGEKFTKKQP